MAEATKISAVTIGNFEKGRASVKESTAQLFRMTFERAGIEFIDANGGGPGVRLKG